MTDPQWQRVCILCSQRGKTRRLETGHCCVECASWLTTQVADIARLAADAAAWVAPGSSTGGGSRPVPGSRPPLNCSAVQPELTVQHHDPKSDPCRDGTCTCPTILVQLEEWERMVRDMRGMAPYGEASLGRNRAISAREGTLDGLNARAAVNDTGVTLIGVTAFLVRQVPWMTTSPEFPLEDFTREITEHVRSLRHYDWNLEDRGHGLRCPTILEDRTCGYFIAWGRDEESVDCPRCRRTWTMDWLIMVAGNDDLWLDAEAISKATGLHEQTIRKWARHKDVRKRGLLYSVKDVQARRGMAQAHSA